MNLKISKIPPVILYLHEPPAATASEINNRREVEIQPLHGAPKCWVPVLAIDIATCLSAKLSALIFLLVLSSERRPTSHAVEMAVAAIAELEIVATARSGSTQVPFIVINFRLSCSDGGPSLRPLELNSVA